MNPKLKAILFAVFMTAVFSADLMHIYKKHLSKKAQKKDNNTYNLSEYAEQR